MAPGEGDVQGKSICGKLILDLEAGMKTLVQEGVDEMFHHGFEVIPIKPAIRELD